MNNQRPRILGIPNRFILLLLIILGILAARAFAPTLPHIQVAPEQYPGNPLFTLPGIGPFYWTNTLTAMVIADVILLLLALAVRRSAQSEEMVPKGLAGVVEFLMEAIYNLTESTAGKWAKEIFPFFATITLLVLVVNWTELIPGVDSIGFLEHSEHGLPVKQLATGIATVVKAETGEGEPTAGTEHSGELYALVPYVRVLSTDLNFTVGLALVAMFMVQVFGVRALGIGYFTKFFNVSALWNVFNKPMGLIDFAVGILELVSEFSKIISFSFRLFGNIFAGSVLLFVIGTLVPVVAQSIFLMLELFVGVIQAFVFGMLCMVFMSQAVAGHGEHAEKHAH